MNGNMIGKIDWSKPLEKEKLQLENATEYMIRVLDMLDEMIGLEGKVVGDIGGSNISPQVAQYYGMKKMICVDPVTMWFKDCGYDVALTQYARIELVKNDTFLEHWETLDYFIVDELAENLTQEYYDKFDVIVSMSTFEHVNSITDTLNNIYNLLKSGGIAFATYEPIFSCAKGHHVWIDENLCFAKLPELDFFHLKYTYEEAGEYLIGIEKFKDHIDTILEQAFHSHVINRKTFNEHIAEISRSRFDEYHICYWSKDREPTLEERLLIERHYERQRFDIRGLAVTAYKQ